MNDILQMILYFFEALDCEFPPIEDFPFSIKEIKEMNFPSSLAIMKKLFPQLEEENTAEGRQPMPDYPTQPHIGIRVFTTHESTIINKKCRGFLYYLEQLGILDSISREKVIEEILHLNAADVTLSRLKWITLAILAEQNDKIATACAERLAFDIQPSRMH